MRGVQIEIDPNAKSVFKDSSAALVLVVGVDAVLLRTRAAVLKRAGFCVISARDAEGVVLSLASFAVQTVLLCHSLDLPVQELVASIVSSPPYKLPVLQLQKCECQPEKLITAVRAATAQYRAEHPLLAIIEPLTPA